MFYSNRKLKDFLKFTSNAGLPVNEIDFIVDFYHGAHQPVRDLQVLEDIQHVHLLIHCLWMADVSDVDQQILEVQKKKKIRASIQQLHSKGHFGITGKTVIYILSV